MSPISFWIFSWDPFRGWTAYGSQQTRQDPEETAELRAARNYIAARHYAEALHVLSNIADRTAKWYYYSAIANAGQGNRILALEHARQACKMDPGNAEYETYLDELERGGNAYRQAGGYTQGVNMGQYCLSICALNLCLRLCCC
jgi:molecular chaperone DnaJ